MTREVVKAEAPITTAARLQFSNEQVSLIRDTVAKNCSEAELHLYLEVCAREDLNPFLGEAWAAKLPGKNGGPGRMAIIVGRHGWIKIANRNPNYAGLDSDVVREKDDFRVIRKPDGTRVIHHEYTGGSRQRGEILGAWCEVRFTDYKPIFFYAPIEEYQGSDKTPWGKQVSTMIQKCAVSTTLRLAFPVGGVYDEAELEKVDVREVPSVVAIDWGDEHDPALAQWLRDLVDAANAVQAGSWLPERVRLKLDGTDPQGRAQLAMEIVGFIRARGGTVPEAPPEDAEVVA